VARHADDDLGSSTAAMLRDLIRAASKKDMIVFFQFLSDVFLIKVEDQVINSLFPRILM
jgi:hypothetical protein